MTTTNCQWCESKIEAYFSDQLTLEEFDLFQAHVASCAECAPQVQGLKDIDPAIQQVFQHRLATAHSAAEWNTRPRVWRLALAGSTVAIAAIIGIGLIYPQRTQAPTGPVASTPATLESAPSSIEDPKKGTSAAQIDRAKLEEGTSVPPAPQPALDSRPTDGPDFAIINDAGQSNSIDAYRGRVLLFGVISPDQKDGTTNLQDLYHAFGSNPKVRILGVPNHREDKIEGASFPIWYNHGSKLMGVQNGQFLLVDAAGVSKVKGSLSSAADIARARTQLGQLTNQPSK